MRMIKDDIEPITHTEEGYYIQKPDRPTGPVFRGDLTMQAMLKEAKEKRLKGRKESQGHEEEQEDYR